jgi:hypothetical protein
MTERDNLAPIVWMKIPIEASDSFSESIIVFGLNPGYIIDPNE